MFYLTGKSECELLSAVGAAEEGGWSSPPPKEVSERGETEPVSTEVSSKGKACSL